MNCPEIMIFHHYLNPYNSLQLKAPFPSFHLRSFPTHALNKIWSFIASVTYRNHSTFFLLNVHGFRCLSSPKLKFHAQNLPLQNSCAFSVHAVDKRTCNRPANVYRPLTVGHLS